MNINTISCHWIIMWSMKCAPFVVSGFFNPIISFAGVDRLFVTVKHRITCVFKYSSSIARDLRIRLIHKLSMNTES